MTTTRTTTALAALWMCAYLQNWHRWLLLHGPVQRRRERAGSVGLVQEVQLLLQGGQRMRNYQSVWLLHGLCLWRYDLDQRSARPLPVRPLFVQWGKKSTLCTHTHIHTVLQYMYHVVIRL